MTRRLARGPDDSVFPPEIIEMIALMIPCPASFRRFPCIVVRSPDLSSAAVKDLGAIATLAPKSVVISYEIRKRQDFEIVAGIASRLTTLQIGFVADTTDSAFSYAPYSGSWTFYRTALASCQRLETLELTDSTGGMSALNGDFLDLPCLTSLTLAIRGSREPLVSVDVLTRLATWVSTKPVKHLALKREVFGLSPDEPSILALCDAIASSTSLTSLRLHGVPPFNRHFLYGRRLPVHLKSLQWDPFHDYVRSSAQGWRNFASAIRHGPQLDHLYCKHFDNFKGQDDAVLAKIRGLTSFRHANFGADGDRATSFRLLTLLGGMVHLKHLSLVAVSVDDDILRRVLSIVGSLRSLETLELNVAGVAPDEYRQLLMLILLSPQLHEVNLSMLEMPTDVVMATLPLLNVATEGLSTMYWACVFCDSGLPNFMQAVKEFATEALRSCRIRRDQQKKSDAVPN
ncbi:hypothetical protein SPRG_02745 [Saprolegnia parasitica CBS 223.65]|uniref:F-box domain-containing protein n=1 Tax=Saprolegnia parasitica (strain CBS 223.65) TaxID=695850 RepID=A0A067D0I7_SAPPC|nr:hypothetical protein SPRG_02745 [Saprolegnia parasitica CBS 223.65]KDO32266.1 hypothetical protein SPRG_02745 [Saprolegnia parasitica CBS 223.65]|eukprot:XP_012196722.1 hypothetical protein SPRG_02745 [Saprolegnia parasitica CBS 223.65]